MNTIDISTVVYLPPEEVYDVLIDFPRYPRYSEHLRGVDRHGDGSAGTTYDLHFAWWKLTYTARSRVTDTDPPNRIDWRVVKDIDANGHWAVEEREPPEGREHASTVHFRVEYDTDSVNPSNFDLPRLVSLSWVVEKVKPVIEREGQRVVERVVADIEGERRPVDLDVETR
ncbi:SRPBCC family protein [Halococcus sp. IIIV-5B]|uniref:SRPBCC family protein n=1 Tax=Halococcus sp. IIIV-5B TaxID=2321230 RepID=UPI000E76382E|nr:SRPBCC family protein [Halococcus sp. IIIV-5B]RJT06533.1 SRPBCC family protein [Halococcus sp. IIIV-5B]